MSQKQDGEGDRLQSSAPESQPCCAKPCRKGIWWLIGGLVAFGAGAGYRWWKELPK